MKRLQQSERRWECNRCDSNFTVYTLPRHSLERACTYGGESIGCPRCGQEELAQYRDPLAKALCVEHANGRQTLQAATYTNYKLAVPTPLRNPDDLAREWDHAHHESFKRGPQLA